MFSQFRNAVEQLAQQQTSPAKRPASNSVSSQGSSTYPRGETDSHRSPTNSLDEGQKPFSATSPSQLAESALLNFKKSLISSRSASPNPSQASDKEHSRQVRSLEDRLRASFALGDASERTTPEDSKLHTPSEVDPASIELPRSPENELPTLSLEAAFDPLGAQPSPSTSQSALSPLPVSTGTMSPRDEPTTPSEAAQKPLINNDLPKVPVSPPRPPSIPQELPDAIVSDVRERQSPSDAIPLPEPTPKSRDLEASAPRNDTRPSTPLPLSLFPFDERELDIEKLRERLKLVEQRFTDVSTSFKRLQAEKRLADQVLKDLTPLESITDVEGLRDHLKNVKIKTEMSIDEIKRLNGRIQEHDARLAELRDIHRLEVASQSEQIERLGKQASEAEALLKAGTDESTKQKAETEQLQSDLEKARGAAKEEEEKRTKAISLLKTVRAKLVKAERERDDALKEIATSKEKDREEREKDQLDRSRIELDLERARLDRERESAALRSQFERELGAVKDRLERENAARKGQSELDAITTKAAHAKEIAAKTSKITSLESSVRALSEEKDNLFDQLQMRQAEVESSQSHLDSVEARFKELQYQLREAEDRVEVLTEELGEANRKVANGHSNGGSFSSAEEVARILSETEGKYEARVGDLRSKLRALEKERHEAEDEWTRNLQERGRELERLRGVVDAKDREYADSLRGKTEMEGRVLGLESENRRLRSQAEAEQGVILGLQKDIEWLKEAETAGKQERDEALTRIAVLGRQLEELQAREATLKGSNKTLREELRKVQSSAAILERQRNPGIGYWGASSRTNGFTQSAVELQNHEHPSRNSVDDASTTSSPRPSSPISVVSTKKDEEVNLEYLRNVILQFLEHKEMRPNLVRVLSIILHFTPQETRRLIAKV